jgi:hypothetical protein
MRNGDRQVEKPTLVIGEVGVLTARAGVVTDETGIVIDSPLDRDVHRRPLAGCAAVLSLRF